MRVVSLVWKSSVVEVVVKIGKKSESKIIATVCGDGASRISSMVENVKFMINHVITSLDSLCKMKPTVLCPTVVHATR